jgi:hypothetical protein
MDAQSFLRAIPAAFATGATPYLTVFLLGLGVNQGWISSPSPALDFLSLWWILLIAAILYVLEKTTMFLPPAIGSVINQFWEIANAVLAPFLGALVGIATAQPSVNSGITIGMTSALVASVPRAARFATNAAMELPGVPLRKLGLSLVLDTVMGFLLAFYVMATSHPVLMIGLGIVTLAFTAFLVYELGALLRWIGFYLGAFWAKMVSWIPNPAKAKSQILPPEHQALLEHHTPDLTAWGMAQKGIQGASWRKGYLSIGNDGAAFTFQTFLLGYKIWQVEANRIRGAYLHRQFFLDILDMFFTDHKNRQRRARLVFLKDKEPLIRQIAERLQARITADGLTQLGDGIVGGVQRGVQATHEGVAQGKKKAGELAKKIKNNWDQN